MMGNNGYSQEACSFENNHTNNCDTSASPDTDDSLCQFLKCVPKEKPIYLEMPGDVCADIDDENINVHCGTRRSNVVAEEHLESSQHPNASQQCKDDDLVKNMTAQQDENHAWIIQWETDEQQEDFIGLSFLGMS